MKEQSTKVQFNVRIREPYKHAAIVASGLFGLKSQDALVEIALQVLLGVEDKETADRREKVIKAWRTMGDKLPFEVAPTDKVNGQNLDTVAVTGSTPVPRTTLAIKFLNGAGAGANSGASGRLNRGDKGNVLRPAPPAYPHTSERLREPLAA